MTGRIAHELAWLERMLPVYPVTARLYEEGRLTHAKVRALLRAYAKPGPWPLVGGLGGELDKVVAASWAASDGATKALLPPTCEALWAQAACSLTVRRLEDALFAWRRSTPGVEQAAGGESVAPADSEPDTVSGCEPTRVTAEGPPFTGGYPLSAPEAYLSPDVCGDERPRGRLVQFAATPTQAAKWYVALEMASRDAGRDLSPAGMLEGALAEFLSGEGYDALARADWANAGTSFLQGGHEHGLGPDSKGEVQAEAASVAQSGAVDSESMHGSSGKKLEGTEDAEAKGDAASASRLSSSEECDEGDFWRGVERDIAETQEHWAHLCWEISTLSGTSGWEFADTDDPFEIDRRLRATLAIKQRSQSSLVRMLGQMAHLGLHFELGFVRFDQYVRERLGMSASLARSLVTLHRRLRHCPRTRESFAAGKIQLTQAQLITRVAQAHTEVAWLERASQTTVRFLRDDVEEALCLAQLLPRDKVGFPPLHLGLGGRGGEAVGVGRSDRRVEPQSSCQTCAGGQQVGVDLSGFICQTCARGVREPVSSDTRTAFEVLADLTGVKPRSGSDFRRLLMGVLGDLRGGPVEEIAPQPGAAPGGRFKNSVSSQHLFLRFWLPRELEPMFDEATAAVAVLRGATVGVACVIDAVLDAYLSQWGHEAIEAIRNHPAIDRSGWRCAVPTCTSRSHLQAHHVRYRSRGGCNKLSNLVALCASHHLHGEHAGYLHVSGEAPHNLLWELGLPPLQARLNGGQAPHLVVRGRKIVQPGEVLAGFGDGVERAA